MNKVRAQAKNLNYFWVFIFVFTLLNTLSVFAGPSRTTYQAKIVKPDGYPLEASNVNFKFTILDPAGSCILYSETYSAVNMSGTGGLISFALGSGVKTYPASATTFENVFSNVTPSLSCDAGGPPSYSPAGSDIRKIVMQFHDGNGWQTLPAMSINAVPYAMYANDALKLNGKTDADFVHVTSIPTCAVSEALHYNGAVFSCVATTETLTSAAVVSALGYTPATGASYTSVTSDLSAVSATVAGVSNYASSVSATVTSLQNSVAASFAAITSSQWNTIASGITYMSGNVGVGTTTPVTTLDVSGGVRIGAENATCAANYAGTLRYNNGNVEYCNGSTWAAFGVSGAGLQSLNGSTSGTQSFAIGTAGTGPAFNTANGVHTLNIPLASAGSVTAGLISNADYTSFANKITSSAAAISQVLGYAPVSATTLSNYVLKANNLSDLASVSTARTNLGLGTFATANSLDLGSASATGTLAIARLPSFTGDATIAAASNTIILANSGVDAGTYTKVTVDSKGRVTSGAQLTNSDVTTALGYTPVNSATIVSSQWTTSGSAIYYNSGNVGVGTAAPAAKFSVNGSALIGGSTMNYTGTTSSAVLVGGSQIVFDGGAASISRLQWNSGTLSFGKCTDATCGPMSPYLDIDTTTNITTFSNMNAVRAGNGNGTAATPTFSFGQNTSTGMYNPGTSILAFSTSGTERVRITSAGAVGIGTTTPTAPLDVANNSATFSIYSIGKIGVKGASSCSSGTPGTCVGLYGENASGTGAGVYGIASTNNAGTVGVYATATGATNAAYALQAINNSATGWGIYSSGTSPNYFAGNVGIGTTTPTALLQVAAGTSTKASFKLTSGTLLTSPQSGTMEYDGENFYLTDGSNTRRTIATGSSTGSIDNASVINSSGNITMVPVGSVVVSSTTASTNSQTGALVVKGGVGVSGNINTAGDLTVSGATTLNSTATVANSGDLRFVAGAAAPNDPGDVIWYNNDMSERARIYSGTSPSPELKFNVSGTTRMVVTSSGSVGIGTTTPATDLEIKGSLAALTLTRSISSAASPDIYLQKDRGVSVPVVAGDTIGHIGFRGLTGDTNYIRGARISSYVTSAPGYGLLGADLRFYTNDSTADAAERMRITASGSVGIGTTAPAYLLQVNHTGANESALVVGDAATLTNNTGIYLRTTGTGKISYGSTGNLSFYRGGPGGTSVMTLDPSSNVGIGTSAPATRLHVFESTTMGSIGSINLNNSVMRVEEAPGVAINFDGNTIAAEADLYLGTKNLNNFHLFVSDTTRLFVAGSTGNVGIGTTSPGFPMTVVGAIKSQRGSAGDQTGITLGSDGVEQPKIEFNASDNSKRFFLRMQGINSSSERLSLYAGPINNSATKEAVTFSGNGNVGVGTSAPTTKLEVAGQDWAGSVIQTTRYQNGTSTGGFWGSHSRGTAVGSYVPLMNGDSVSDFGAIGFFDTNVSSTSTAGHMTISAEGDWSTSNKAGYIKFLTANSAGSTSEKMRITSNGNVGIGSVSPTQKLDITGSIRAGNYTATTGSVMLMDAYTSGSLTNLGTEYSSGGPMLGYGVIPSNAAVGTFLSSTPISNLSRSALNMSDTIRFYLGGVQTVATGSSVSLSEVMRIATTGVGIGTSSPSARLEVSRNFNGESNTTAGFIGGYDAGFTNTGAYFVQKDNTGLGSANTFLFNVVKNSVSQFVVNGAGNVGVGTTSPIATLHVSGTGYIKDGGNSLIELLSRTDSAFNVTNNSTTKRGFSLHHENSSALIAQWYYCPSGSCTQKLSFDYAGNMVIAGTLTQSSDIRLKKDIVPLQHSLDKILSLNGVSYYWKDKEVPGKQIGLIAQEVEKVFPEIIKKDEKGFLSVGYQNLVAPLIESVKELYAKVMTLFERTDEQSRQIASLQAENTKLKENDKAKDQKIKELEERMQKIEKALNQK